MVGIFIVALGGIQRNTRGVLFGKANFRCAFIRVNLDGERLGGAQYFEQERQFAETLGDVSAEKGIFIGLNDVAQRLRLAVGVKDPRTAFRVCAHPQFRHRQIVRIGDTVKVG